MQSQFAALWNFQSLYVSVCMAAFVKERYFTQNNCYLNCSLIIENELHIKSIPLPQALCWIIILPLFHCQHVASKSISYPLYFPYLAAVLSNKSVTSLLMSVLQKIYAQWITVCTNLQAWNLSFYVYTNTKPTKTLTKWKLNNNIWEQSHTKM